MDGNSINVKLLSSTSGIVYYSVLKGQVLTFGRGDEIVLKMIFPFENESY